MNFEGNGNNKAVTKFIQLEENDFKGIIFLFSF